MGVTLENFRQDFHYALRGVRQKPGFAAAVIATLGLGIGANTAMFGIVDRLLFRPPALMRDPATVHRPYFYQTFRGVERATGDGRYARYKDLQKWTRSLAGIAGYSQRDMAVGVGEAAREMSIGIVSASFFDFFDAPPAAGRYFTDAEDQPPAGTPVTVISHVRWHTEFGGRREAIGSSMQIGPTIYTIIGVTPPGFAGVWADRPPAAFIPLTSYAGSAFVGFLRGNTNWWTTYSLGWMSTIVRRKPGVSIEAANADLTQAFLLSLEAQRVEQSGPPPEANAPRPRVEAWSILEGRGPNPSNTSKVATWVGGVSVIVLLIACANVANLLLARALHRRREIALRLALGVSRVRLSSQLLIESLVLAVAGGTAGVLVAHWGGAALRTFLLERSEAAGGFRDPRTVLYALGAAVVVGVLCGLAPMLQAGRADLTADLKAGTREGTYGRSRTRVALLIVQGALSVVLLVGAGLFVRSVRNVEGVRMGYDTEPILVVGLNMRGVQLDSAESVTLKARLLDAARSLPAVEHASLQAAVPFWSTTNFGIAVPGIDSVNRLGAFYVNRVSPEFFATMGTRIIRGRGINDADVQGAPRAAVIGDAMGKVLWPGKDPIGQCFKVGTDTMPCTYVVGIAENIMDRNLTGDSSYYYYLPAAQSYVRFGGLFVRTRGDGTRFVEEVRRRLQQVMPGASYVTITPFSEIIGRQKRSWHLGATMFVAFGVLALVLAAVGLYSVIAYNVAQRAHEMGVRVALGAQPRDLTRLVVLDGLRLAGIGVVIGTLISLWAGRSVENLLFGVSAKDPLVFTLVGVTLIAVAVAASWIPALRASRVEPNVVLRAE